MFSHCHHTDPQGAAPPAWAWYAQSCPWCGRTPYDCAPAYPQHYLYWLHQEMIADPAAAEAETRLRAAVRPLSQADGVRGSAPSRLSGER